MIMQAMKTHCWETKLWGICLHFLRIVTVNHHRILNNKPYVARRRWLKVKLSFFLLNLIACYLHSALFFVELIEPTEGLSLIHSCSRSRTNRQIHKEVKWHTKNIISQFPQISFTFLDYIKIVHSTEGNFLFGSSHCSWDHLANYSLKRVLKYGASALRLARKYKISFLC